MKDFTGLTSAEAKERLKKFGLNKLIRTKTVSPFRIFLTQFTSPLILVLIAAAIISMSIGFFPGQDSNMVDAMLILIIVLLSGIMGFVQDYNAEKTIEALQEMASPQAKVLRDGKEVEISSEEIVPDDVLLIESGDMITSDCNVLEAFHLEVDESVLTGESVAIRKQNNEEIFMHTYVTGGNAKALVLRTGMKTKMGEVASKLQELKKEKSTFQIELESLSKKLSIITLIITIVIAVVGIFKFGLYSSLLTAISLAVAAIPEGLPAVVVLALAAGAKIMVKRKALIRKLPIVESIGAVNIICTDKTGTLTKNEMTVTQLFYNDQTVTSSKINADFSWNETGKALLKCATLCNNATLGNDKEGAPKYFGEQTEIALKKFVAKYLPENASGYYKKVNEVSFSSQRKMMTVVMKDDEQNFTVFSKGAPEVLIEKCNRIYNTNGIIDLSDEVKQKILRQNQQFASQALRVLGFAYKPTDKPQDGLEEELIWIGLLALIDPPRPEVKEALEDCKTAGIRVIMITGDNPATAQAIAKQVGLQSDKVLEGTFLDTINDDDLGKELDTGANIFARTNPFHKLRLLEILEKDNTVAMTGDGVNDALAIKRAAVGIAMGKKGTEVAKQAADVILLDDNFSTIRNAVMEGRTIFNNIRKFIDYLLTCNLAEVLLIFIATIFFDLNEPLLFPVQLLWINLLTDGLVALALGVDPPAADIMLKKPRKLGEPLINRRLAWLIGLIGIKKTAVLIASFLIVLPMGIEVARTTLLTGVVLYEFVRIAAIRYEDKLSWFANKWLVAGLVVSVLLHVALVYSPLNSFFYLVPLGLKEWAVLFGGAFVGYWLAILITWAVMKKYPDY